MRKHLSVNGKVRIVFYSVMYILAIIYSCAFEVYSYDSSIISYRYNTDPGILIVFLRLWACIWFCYALRSTFNKFTTKRNFYYKFAAVYIGWFVSLPLFALFSIAVSSENVILFVFTWENLLVFFGQLALMILYNPYTSSFPFHATVNESLEANGIVHKLKRDELEVGIENNDRPIHEYYVRRGNTKVEALYENIRMVGGGMAKKLLIINNLAKKLTDILLDWEGEDDDDIEYTSH